jgi:hypothetical protein
MKKIIAALILLASVFLLTNCGGSLMSFREEFPKALYSYDTLYDATLLYLNQKGEVVTNTEKSVGLIHTNLENILLTQTYDRIIYTRSAKFLSSSDDESTAWNDYNEKIINDIIDEYSKMTPKQ